MKIFRFIAIVFACGLMLFSSVAPAVAATADPTINSTKSSPSKGAAQLDGVYNSAKDALKSEPLPNKDDQKKVGAADLNVAQESAKGEQSTDANSASAKTIESSVEDILEDVLP
ncbi:MAG: hypothetical protein WBA10_11735 [Elainellaceae cyanobacterium]